MLVEQNIINIKPKRQILGWNIISISFHKLTSVHRDSNYVEHHAMAGLKIVSITIHTPLVPFWEGYLTPLTSKVQITLVPILVTR